MQLDPAMLQKVLSMNDGELWKTICLVASQSGLALSAKMPSPAEMAKLRGALSSVTSKDMESALRLVQELQSGAKKQ